MELLEATVDLSVELVKFINVDLLSKGDYRVSVEIEPNEKLRVVAKSVSRNEYADKSEVRDNLVGFSKSLEVEFKHSRHSLDELFNFQITFLVDPVQPIESANTTEIKLKLTLWGVPHRISKASPLRVREAMMDVMSFRVMRLHIPVQEGLHWASPVVFEFCHRASVSIVAHAQLWSLSQPKIWRATTLAFTSLHQTGIPATNSTAGMSHSASANNLQSNGAGPELTLTSSSVTNNNSNQKSNTSKSRTVVESQPNESTGLATLSTNGNEAGSGGIATGDIEHVLFGRALLPTDTMQDFDRNKVMSISKNIFYTLLVAQKSILDAMQDHNPFFSPPIENMSGRKIDIPSKLKQFMSKMMNCECADDIVAVVGTNLASLDAENMVLWEEYIKAATVMLCNLDSMEILSPNYSLNTHLFKQHHTMAVEKYSEAFFYSYRPKALAESYVSSEMRQQVSDLLRNHNYIKNLPPLPIECLDSHLNPVNMPIIFEEIYVENPSEYHSMAPPNDAAPESSSVVVFDDDDCDYVGSKRTNSNVVTPRSLSCRTDVTPSIEVDSCASAEVIRTPRNLSSRTSRASSNNRSFKKNHFKTGSIASSSPSTSEMCSTCKGPLKSSSSFTSRRRLKSSTPNRLLEEELEDIGSSLNVPFAAQSRSTKSFSTDAKLALVKSPTRAIDVNSTKSVGSEKDSYRSVTESSVVATDHDSSDSSNESFSSARTTTSSSSLQKYQCKSCEKEPVVDSLKGYKDAKDMIKSLSSSMETSNYQSFSGTIKTEETKADTRSVSPFQAILAVSLEVGASLSFLDDVQCSRVEPLLYTAKHAKRFRVTRQEAKYLLMDLNIKLNWYCDYNPNNFISSEPFYLSAANEFSQSIPGLPPMQMPTHLVVCVHGLDGNSQDLRTLRTFLLMGMKLPLSRIKFLMSRANEDDTYEGIESLTGKLVDEVDSYIKQNQNSFTIDRISFVGHSLGAVIVRAALADPRMKRYHHLLYTFLSLAGPHLGTGYQNSKLVSAGMWVFQKIKKSPAILQLALKDEIFLDKSFIYKLSTQKGLEFFKNVLLVSSYQDKYVPPHSARIELCEKAVKDDSLFGRTYRAMVYNILEPIMAKSDLKLVRYDVSFPLSASATNNLIGRTAHIAVLDSEIWLEKFFSIVGLKYFT